MPNVGNVTVGVTAEDDGAIRDTQKIADEASRSAIVELGVKVSKGAKRIVQAEVANFARALGQDIELDVDVNTSALDRARVAAFKFGASLDNANRKGIEFTKGIGKLRTSIAQYQSIQAAVAVGALGLGNAVIGLGASFVALTGNLVQASTSL